VTDIAPIVKFIQDRLEEDEAAAMNSQNILSGSWYVDAGGNILDKSPGGELIAPGTGSGALDSADAIHIARHGPARTLIEIAAKRRMLGELTRWPFEYRPGCNDNAHLFVHLMAVAWNDHPDYLPEWNISDPEESAQGTAESPVRAASPPEVRPADSDRPVTAKVITITQGEMQIGGTAALLIREAAAEDLGIIRGLVDEATEYRGDGIARDWIRVTDDHGTVLWEDYVDGGPGSSPDPQYLAQTEERAERYLNDLDWRVTETLWSMRAHQIDIQRGDLRAVKDSLSDGLDGFTGPDWDGTEPGTQWYQRTLPDRAAFGKGPVPGWPA